VGVPLEFTRDGKTLALAVMPARGKLALQLVETSTWKVSKGIDLNPLHQFTTYGLRSMRYLPDGRALAAAADNAVLLFDTQTSQYQILGHHASRDCPGYFGDGPGVSVLALSPDGRLLATGGHEDRPTIRLWDLTTRRQVHKLQHPAGHYVFGLAFSPDGTQLVSGVNWDEDGQGAVCLWELLPQSARMTP
jgi:WD40 repeat protein